MDSPRTFHLHMISDATGETLVAIAKAVRVQYVASPTPSSICIPWCVASASWTGC